MESSIKFPKKADKGHKKINWVSQYMDILNQIKKKYKKAQPLKNNKVAICLHLEAKTAYMAKMIGELGAEVAICGSNPLSTQDDVAAALVDEGIEVHSWYNATPDEYNNHLNKVLKLNPDLIIDDGGDLVSKIHSEKTELIDKIIG